MTTLAINYFVNPFAGFMHKIYKSFELVGYSRAASELTRLGYHKEAKKCIEMRDALKAVK